MTIFPSIVIPCFNEAGNIGPLLDSILNICRNHFDNYEIIVVDDGSKDATYEEAKSRSIRHKEIFVVSLKKNFGQTAALAAGIDQSKGDIIVTIDGDQQNDPKDIPLLISKITEGYDVVSGWRKYRKDSFVNRILPSILANKIISFVTGVKLNDYGCTLKAYRKSAIKNLQLYGEMHRFIPAWCAWQGGRLAEIPVQHHPRKIGQSKYGLFRIIKVLIDLLTVKFFSSYLSKPNYLFSGTAFFCFFISIFSLIIALVDKFGPDKFSQFRIPLLLCWLGFGLTSVIFVLMGLIAELLVKIYFQNNNQKPYRIKSEDTF